MTQPCKKVKKIMLMEARLENGLGSMKSEEMHFLR